MTEIEREKEVEEYARKILSEHRCDEYTYGDETAETILKDIKEEYPNGMQFPYVEVANAIKRISKPKMIERKPFCVVWNTDSFCDGMECDTFEEAKGIALETLINWEMEEFSAWKSAEPTEKESEDWDYMIYNCESFVLKYDADKDEYEDYWYPSDEELDEIGWCLWEENKKKENSIGR